MIKLILTLSKPNSIFSLHHNYEDEFFKCVEAWRKNAGWLKNIEIHVATDYDFKCNLKNVFIHYIKNLNLGEKRFNYSVVHTAGDYFQKLFPKDTLIHIDIDMYCTKPIPISFLKVKQCLIEEYSNFSDSKERLEILKKLGIKRMVNTDFIITKPGCKFYEKYIEKFKVLKKTEKNDFWSFEELVADIVVHENNYNIVNEYEICTNYDFV